MRWTPWSRRVGERAPGAFGRQGFGHIRHQARSAGSVRGGRLRAPRRLLGGESASAV